MPFNFSYSPWGSNFVFGTDASEWKLIQIRDHPYINQHYGNRNRKKLLLWQPFSILVRNIPLKGKSPKVMDSDIQHPPPLTSTRVYVCVCVCVHCVCYGYHLWLSESLLIKLTVPRENMEESEMKTKTRREALPSPASFCPLSSQCFGIYESLYLGVFGVILNVSSPTPKHEYVPLRFLYPIEGSFLSYSSFSLWKS